MIKISNLLKKKNKFKINILTDNLMIISDYKIEFKNKSKKVLNTLENITKLKKIKPEIINNNLEKVKKFKKRKFKKKKFFKKKTI